MKKLLLLIILMSITVEANSQDTIKKRPDNPKFQLSFQAGGFYKHFIGNRYIKPTNHNSDDVFEDHQFERFSKQPTWGYKAGLLMNIKISKHLYFTTGAFYCFRRDVFEIKFDSIIKYLHSSLSIHNIYNVFKYDYAYSDIELPIMFLYKWKHLNIYAGVYYPLLIYRKATYSYLMYDYSGVSDFSESEKTIKTLRAPIKFFPCWQISYAFKIKKFSLEPYLGIDFGSRESFYTQCGVIFSFYNYMKNNAK